jgi:RimJ/RimL family protein N-acetyltransferase
VTLLLARLQAMPDRSSQDDRLFPPGGRVPMLAHGSVYLRAAERSDIPTFVRWYTDLRTTQTLLMSSPMGHAAEERWFDQMLDAHGKDRWFFVICRREDDRAVGGIDLHEVNLRSGSASLGIAIGDPADTGRGYGSDALLSLLGFGFGQLRLERIELDVYDFNDRARRVYERVGFAHEGTLRRALFRDGAFHDVHRMAILRDEWAARAEPEAGR